VLVLACGSAGAPATSSPVRERGTQSAVVSSAQGELCPIPPFPYEPQPRSKVKVALPSVPWLSREQIRVGDAFSVWGASYSLRSEVHRSDVTGKEITLRGYIIKTNLPEAPRCAVHSSDKANPQNCAAPVPAFWLADTLRAPVWDAIKVVGWASSYAQIFEAIRAYDSPEGGRYDDAFWGQTLPSPLPAVGAKVTVTGVYAMTFRKGSSGVEFDPYMGILEYRKMETLARAPELATLPGVKRKKR
jgi:hypothetical protein